MRGIEALQAMQAKQQGIADSVAQWLSARPWTSASFFYAAAGRASMLRGSVVQADGTTVALPSPEPLVADFDQLREIMADETTGAWLSATLSLESSGDFSFDFDSDRRVYFDQPDPYVPPRDDFELVPPDFVWKTELERFPRSSATTPAWMNDLREPEYATRTPPLPDGLVTLLKSFDSMRPTEGAFFHGLAAPLPYEGTFYSRGIVPASRDIRVATENFSVPQLAVILAQTGRDIAAVSQKPVEQEVVMRPGTFYRPLGRRMLDGAPALELVVLQEITSVIGGAPELWHDYAESVLDDASQLVEEARALEPVQVTSPGKFVDEIS